MALVETDVAGGVCTITLNDVAHRNTLNAALTSELVVALDRAEADPAVRVVVLTNAGPVFCAGADLADRTAANPGAGATTAIDPVALFGRFRESPKPFVGRIDGHCVAGGMGLVAGLDITVAREDVRFGFTEVRVGVAPAMISVVCLPRMRLADAQSAFLRGRRFAAAEAVRMGLLTSAVPGDRLDAEVAEVVDDLLQAGPGALAATKQLLARVPGMPREEAFAWTAELSAGLFASEEAHEGMTAFRAKRPPSWVPPTATGP